MTATVTALIELAADHGLGVAFLLVGAQVLLDRLNPVGYVASHLFGPKGSAHGAGAHRRDREPAAFRGEQIHVDPGTTPERAAWVHEIKPDSSPFRSTRLTTWRK